MYNVDVGITVARGPLTLSPGKQDPQTKRRSAPSRCPSLSVPHARTGASSATIMVQAAKVSASDGSEEANIGLRSAEAEHLEHGDSDAEARSPQTRSGMQTSSDMPEHGGHSMAPPDWSPAGVQDMLMPYLNKGSISNLATFSVMLLGMMMTAATKAEHACPAEPETFGQAMARWVLAAGLFGFAGGITNWVAIKMLFDRVCNLPGSGVIPMRFKEIRQVIKDTIMKTFFDGPYLEQYMNKKMASLAGELNLGAKLKEVTGHPRPDGTQWPA